MKLRIIETVLQEAIADVKKYYPNIDDDTFMEIIALDPTYKGKDSVGKYGKWLLNLFNKNKISKSDFTEIPDLLNQFTIYRNRIQNKDLNSYKTLDDLADILSQVVDDDSMLTPRQKVRFLKNVKSGKVQIDASDDFDVVLDTPQFIVYVPNTHEASMKLGKGTEWCTAHENPEWYEKYTKEGHKLYIVKDKKTGERWQYSDDTGDFLDRDDEKFDVTELMRKDKKLSKFFEKFLGFDYFSFDGNWVYDGKEIPDNIKKEITKIIVKDGVTSIDDYAFRGCSDLTSIIISNSVTSVGNEAFDRCSKLTSIIIPNSVTRIGNSAFSYCSNLTSITIPDSITSISWRAFNGCKNLTSITIPNSVTRISTNAFSYCSSLKNITIPNSVISIGYYAFQRCSSLTSITIPNSTTSIDDGTFYGCSSLESITIPNSITSIGEDAFEDCYSLTVYTDNDYATNYCKENNVPVQPLKAKNESYSKPLKLKIREL